jgi:hypothetical protein
MDRAGYHCSASFPAVPYLDDGRSCSKFEYYSIIAAPSAAYSPNFATNLGLSALKNSVSLKRFNKGFR